MKIKTFCTVSERLFDLKAIGHTYVALLQAILLTLRQSSRPHWPSESADASGWRQHFCLQIKIGHSINYEFKFTYIIKYLS